MLKLTYPVTVAVTLSLASRVSLKEAPSLNGRDLYFAGEDLYSAWEDLDSDEADHVLSGRSSVLDYHCVLKKQPRRIIL